MPASDSTAPGCVFGCLTPATALGDRRGDTEIHRATAELARRQSGYTPTGGERPPSINTSVLTVHFYTNVVGTLLVAPLPRGGAYSTTERSSAEDLPSRPGRTSNRTFCPSRSVPSPARSTRGDVDESVFRAIFGLDEPVALGGVEPLHGSSWHGRFLQWGQGRWLRRCGRWNAMVARGGAKAVHRRRGVVGYRRRQESTREDARKRERQSRARHEVAGRTVQESRRNTTPQRETAAERAKMRRKDRPHGETPTPPGRQMSPLDGRQRADSRPAGARAAPTYPRTVSRRVWPALNEGDLEAAIAMLSPVRGLRP